MASAIFRRCCESGGGMVPAAIVARELGMGVIDTSSCASYVGENVQGEMKILKSVRSCGGGEDLLMIGDLADTGATVKLIRAVLP